MADTSFSTRLLTWWDRHGRKNLPWQNERTPYRVWVAEIMLQQTQVKTVIPYFERFTARFPDMNTLADASVDEVLALWSGLGYYARARNLLRTAKICAEQHTGELPLTPEALLALPGIGESTANAIWSQANNHPAVVLDGNVQRVFARHDAIAGWPGKSSVRRKLWSAAEQVLPESRGADYTQAVMDLGATLCTRKNPVCDQCPVNSDCSSFRTGTVEQLPTPRPRLKITAHSFHVLILIDDQGRVLLERRPPTGIWGGLWSLPEHHNRQALEQRLGVEHDDMQSLPSLRHQLTHMKMTIHPHIGPAKPLATGVECNQDQRWFGPQDWSKIGLPKPIRQLLESHLAGDTTMSIRK